MSMHDLTGFQRDLLYVIGGLSRPSGQEVRRRFLETSGLSVAQGQLYSNLNALVDEGLVEKGSIDRRTNYYELRPRGYDLLAERREWERQQLRRDAPTEFVQ